MTDLAEIEKECLDVDQGGKQLHFDFINRQSYGILTEEELASFLDVEPLTLSKWRREGTGPRYAKPGKKVYYQIKHVIDWLDKHAYSVRTGVPDGQPAG